MAVTPYIVFTGSRECFAELAAGSGVRAGAVAAYQWSSFGLGLVREAAETIDAPALFQQHCQLPLAPIRFGVRPALLPENLERHCAGRAVK